MAKPILEIKNLTFTYSDGTPFRKTALNNINLSIEKGSFVGIIGHTGSGKSTLVSHLNGLIKPQVGEILFEGKDIWSDKKKIREYRFKIGLVFQYPEYQLFDETVKSDIAFGPRNMGLSEEEIESNVRMASEVVGITDEMLSKSPFELSGGEQRRVALAGVLAMRPEVLVLDEPTAALDPFSRDNILKRLKKYQTESNTTIILVSHSMEDIAKVADKVVVMNNSEVAFDGTIPYVFSHGEELEKMGLNIPVITRIFLELKKKGIDVSDNVFTTKQAVSELLNVFGGKNA